MVLKKLVFFLQTKRHIKNCYIRRRKVNQTRQNKCKLVRPSIRLLFIVQNNQTVIYTKNYSNLKKFYAICLKYFLFEKYKAFLLVKSNKRRIEVPAKPLDLTNIAKTSKKGTKDGYLAAINLNKNLIKNYLVPNIQQF